MLGTAVEPAVALMIHLVVEVAMNSTVWSRMATVENANTLDSDVPNVIEPSVDASTTFLTVVGVGAVTILVRPVTGVGNR